MDEKKTGKLVCLSDSVGSSFKLKVRSNTFSELLARRLGLEYSPHILSGATSGEELRLLREDQTLMDDVRGAEIVLIVCGSNNITLTYLTVMSEAVGIPFSGRMISAIVNTLRDNPLKAAKMLRAMTCRETKEIIQRGVDDFRAEMPLVYARVRELNPNAIIMVQTVFSLADTTKNAVYRMVSRGQAGYIEQMNDWVRSTAGEYGILVGDVARAMKGYSGDEDLTNVKTSDIHLTDTGHLFVDRLLYDTVAAGYPGFAREEAPDVVHVRRMQTREERLARERSDNVAAGSEYAGAVVSAVYEVAGRDNFEVDMNRQFIDMGMHEMDVLEVARRIERRCFDGREMFSIMNYDFGCRITPMYFLDVIEGRYPESVMLHRERLERFACESERAESEAVDTEGLRIIRSAVREYLGDGLVKAEPEMTFYGGLCFNYNDMSEVSRLAELYLKDTRIMAMRRSRPETVTVGEAAAFIDAVLAR